MTWKHGTTGGYTHHKCRCEPCREAQSAYRRMQYRAKRDGTWVTTRKVSPRKPCTGPACEREAVFMTPQPLCGGHMQQIYAGRPLAALRRRRNVKNGMKECRLCGETFPSEEFNCGKHRRSQCRACQAIYDRMIRYRLSYEEVKALLNQPCDGCGTIPERIHIDHCHTTNKVRGGLCHNCNAVLTKHMTPPILRRLADYLEQR